MLNEPNKPQNYKRDYFIIWTLAFLSFAVGIYFEVSYVGAIFMLIWVFLPLFRFRKYHAEMRAFRQSQIELSGSVSNLNVNENIARYAKEKRLQKKSAKWWQFWV